MCSAAVLEQFNLVFSHLVDGMKRQREQRFLQTIVLQYVQTVH